ncbi:hypothetical protein P8452_52539 [Trifolium repens]|nr:hypothetical protein P8452_52539 [Trifolium repens]
MEKKGRFHFLFVSESENKRKVVLPLGLLVIQNKGWVPLAPLGSKQALISLSDKKDLAFVGNGLQELGFTIVSTGGTASALESAGVAVTKVEQLTQFPEMVSVFVV